MTQIPKSVLQQVAEALEESAADLQAELNDRYGVPDIHPALRRKYERDMEPVTKATEALTALRPYLDDPYTGKGFRVEHDGFQGTVIGGYTRLDGEEGVVMQQDGTKVVHVYRKKWLAPVEHEGERMKKPR